MQPSDPVRRTQATRRLKGMLGALALTTAALGLLLYPTLGFGLLLTPFAVFVLGCGLVLPLDGHDLHLRKARAQLDAERQQAAARHSLPRAAGPDRTASQHQSRSRTSGYDAAAQQAEAESFAHTRRAIEAAEARGIHFASGHLSDADFLQAFAANELRAQDFRHGDHLRYAWLTLERLPFDMAEESIAARCAASCATSAAPTRKFHSTHTHTHGWVRVLASLPERTFADALDAHPGLLHSNALTLYWSPELLQSAAARAAAVPTDLQPLPAPAGRRTRRYRQGHTSLPPAPYAPVGSSRDLA